MDPITAFTEYEESSTKAIAGADSEQALEQVRVEFLGQKKGLLRELQTMIGKAGQDQRPILGKKFNEVKARVTAVFEERKQQLQKPRTQQAGLDVTLPGQPFEQGRRHPLTQTIDEFKDLMGRFGFTVADGPEIEDERHNFVALNIPEEHPARDPLDNFYLSTAQTSAAGMADDQGPVLLRSQTSTVQIRVMETTKPPIRIVSVGRVYRPDTIDRTHSCMFHQMEGLMVGHDVTMAQLKTVLSMFAHTYLGEDVNVRFRPSFFPFTEPSVEVDMSWGDGWMEIGGAGMVDPNVLQAVGYDLERFCMRRHHIEDIRRFYENDVRFLRQF
jgi:phenylalanyl-tRNA synthetase alpha chain